MAKSKDQPAYLKEIIKKHGNIIIRGNELLEQKKDYKVVSVSPAIDMSLGGGIREGSWLMLSGPPKCGKAQPYTSLVYTPDGPKMMGDIEVGDKVCTPKNGVANVIGVYPQGTRKVLKFTFGDGSTCRCDREHLWKVQHVTSKEWSIKTAEELFFDHRLSDRAKWSTPHAGILNFTKKETPIPPYILGVMLHCGSVSSNGQIKVTFRRDECRDKFTKLWNDTYGETPNLGSGPFRCQKFLRDLELINLKLNRRYKNIPDQYRYSSFQDRYDLLYGYIDGAAGYNRNFIAATNIQLSSNLCEMLRTLGGLCRISNRSLHHRHVKVFKNQHFQLGPISEIDLGAKKISKIEETHDELCQCIEIDSEDKLYITDGINVTHNTTTAMQLAYQCQQEGRPVIYANSEGRLNELNFEVEGLDPEKMTIITAEDEPISAEVFLDVIHKLISVPENHGALCIIDSISSLIPEKDLDGEVTGSLRPGLPKILSNFVKKCGQIVPNNKNIMCMITHIIANTSGFGKSSMADGGIKIQFQADTRMEVKSVTPWVTTDKTRIGQAVKWTVYYSGLGAKNYECDSWIRYGKGIDKTQELIIMAMELGLISQAGAWMTCDFLYSNPKLLNSINNSIVLNDDGTYVEEDLALKACKVNGQDKLYSFISENPTVLDYLFSELKLIMGV
jgi:RecA/RadA recombinase